MKSHVRGAHTEDKQFMNGGLKMRKWVCAAYEAWKLAGSVGEPMLMQRVAQSVSAASQGPVIAPVRTLRDELLTCIDDKGSMLPSQTGYIFSLEAEVVTTIPGDDGLPK